MTRSRWTVLLFASLVPACRTAAPTAPPAAPALPDLLRPYEGALRILVHRGDERALTVRAGEHLVGECDVAVRVRSVAFDRGAVRFALDSLGLPRVGERRVSCKRLEPAIQMIFTDLPAGPPTPELTARIDEVLTTPEGYLRSKGTAFDRPPGEVPPEVASQQVDAKEEERRLGRRVAAWPQKLLSVDATYHDPAGRVHFDRLVEVEAIVGTDGRVHRPRLRSTVEPAQEAVVLGVLAFWRLEPARRAEGEVAARVTLELSLRAY
ncbi:MAG TPA: hypothetical protein VMT70_15765 [Vicinamibacteria bacterium]|nr:hypothetical protein [Vicinamibacteria bacterium]